MKRMAAPAMDPGMEPRPPSTTMATKSTLALKSKRSGVICPRKIGCTTPASPAQRAEEVKAMSFTRTVSMPMHLAAVSSSRSAKSARPKRERESSVTQTTQRTRSPRANQ